MPEASIQGQQYVVEAVGPDVKDGLKKGDIVLISGKVGGDMGLLPNDSTLMMCSQKSIIVVLEPVSSEDE